MENKKRYQIAFNVNYNLREEIKKLAARRNISMNLWILRAIYERINSETKFDKDGKDKNAGK